MKYKAALVTVNYNNSRALLRLVEAASRMENADSLQIIVVDNSSAEREFFDTIKAFPRVQWIQSTENLGGAGGFNLGISKALDLGSEFIWLMDNDAYPVAGTYTKFLEGMKEKAEVGALGCIIQAHGHPRQVQELGGNLDWLRCRTHLIGNGPLDEIPNQKFITVDYSPACSLFIRRTALEKSGNIDPRFFLFFDDIELCYRIRMAGFKVESLTETSIFHEFYAQKSFGYLRYYYMSRSRKYFFLDLAKNSLISKCFLSASLSLATALEATVFFFTARYDLIRASYDATRDYLLNHTGRLAGSVPTSETAHSDAPVSPKIDRPAFIGFTSQQEAIEALKEVQYSHPPVLMCDMDQLGKIEKDSIFEVIGYSKTAMGILCAYFGMRRLKPTASITKAQQIDCFSFFYKTRFIYSSGKLFKFHGPSLFTRIFQLGIGMAVTPVIVVVLFLAIFLKTVTFPLQALGGTKNV